MRADGLEKKSRKSWTRNVVALLSVSSTDPFHAVGKFILNTKRFYNSDISKVTGENIMKMWEKLRHTDAGSLF